MPLIKAVMVEMVGTQGATCQLKAADYVPLAEWSYTEEPFAFHRIDCGPLERGEYDVIAYGYGSNGAARIKIDEGGAVIQTQ